MNKYGKLAYDHWSRWLPQRFSEIADPQDFFSTLGNQVEEQVLDLAEQMRVPDQPGEGYLAKVGRLNMDRLRAEEVILADLVLLSPEPEMEQAEEPEDDADLAFMMETQREIAEILRGEPTA